MKSGTMTAPQAELQRLWDIVGERHGQMCAAQDRWRAEGTQDACRAFKTAEATWEAAYQDYRREWLRQLAEAEAKKSRAALGDRRGSE